MTTRVDLLQTYQQSTANAYSIAMGVHQLRPEISLFQRILPKEQATATTHEWIEDELLPYRSALSATVSDTTGTTIDVTAGHGATHFADADSVDTMVKIDDEAMLITGRTTDALTVTRGYGGTTAATHASLGNIWILPQLESQGADLKDAVAVQRTRPSNFLETFSRAIEVTGVQEAVQKFGGITSELQYQMIQRMTGLARELEMAIIHNPTGTVGATGTPARMTGLKQLITSNTASVATKVTTDNIEDDIRTLWDAGSSATVIVGSGNVIQGITNLYSDRIRESDVFFITGGGVVTTIVNPLAEQPLALVPHRMLQNEYLMLNLNKIALGYLRPFFLKDLADAGDSDKRGIYGDYTLRCVNEEAHARRAFTGY